MKPDLEALLADALEGTLPGYVEETHLDGVKEDYMALAEQDRLIASIVAEDDGFVRRVMRRLPARPSRLVLAWKIALAAAVAALALFAWAMHRPPPVPVETAPQVRHDAPAVPPKPAEPKVVVPVPPAPPEPPPAPPVQAPVPHPPTPTPPPLERPEPSQRLVAGGFKLGVVNLKTCFEKDKVDRIKEIDVELQKKSDEYLRKLTDIDKRLMELKEQIDSLPRESPLRAEKMLLFRRAETDRKFEQEYGKTKYLEYYSDRKIEIYNDVRRAVAMIAQEQKFDLILRVDTPLLDEQDPETVTQRINNRVVLYSHENVDITTHVIKRLNDEWAKAKAAGPPESRKHKIDATVVEAAPDEKEPPGFVCKGTTDLPDGCRIDIFTHFLNPTASDPKPKPEIGSHRQRSVVTVKDGRFSASVSLYPTDSLYPRKNISGGYVFRMTFDPNLQAQPFASFAPVQSDIPLKLGTADEAAKDRAAIGGHLFEEIKALVAIADEAAAKRKEDKESGKPDPAAWAALLKEWKDRAGKINKRVALTPSYLIMEMNGISDTGLEHMTGIVIDLADCASKGQDGDSRVGRERLALMVSSFDHQLRGTPVNPRITRIELAKDARGALDAAVNASDDRGPLGRKRFRQVLLDLHKVVPPEARPVLIEMSAAATDLFDTLDQKKDAKALFEKLDARLEEMLKGFQNEK